MPDVHGTITISAWAGSTTPPTVLTAICWNYCHRNPGIINVAICGGGIVPLLFGMIADTSGSLAVALALPALCYAVIAHFGVFVRRPA